MIKTLRAAAEYAGVSYETIRNWHRIYGVGEYRGKVYYVEPADLAPFINRHKMRLLAEEELKK